jgi:hypothetical protein
MSQVNGIHPHAFHLTTASTGVKEKSSLSPTLADLRKGSESLELSEERVAGTLGVQNLAARRMILV